MASIGAEPLRPLTQEEIAAAARRGEQGKVVRRLAEITILQAEGVLTEKTRAEGSKMYQALSEELGILELADQIATNLRHLESSNPRKQSFFFEELFA